MRLYLQKKLFLGFFIKPSCHSQTGGGSGSSVCHEGLHGGGADRMPSNVHTKLANHTLISKAPKCLDVEIFYLSLW